MTAPSIHMNTTPDGLFDLTARLDACLTMPHANVPQAIADTLSQVIRLGDVLTEAQQQGSPHGYTRHILHSDRVGRYTLVALVWHPGQRTPAHGHHTWCAYSVIEGALKEERFGWDDMKKGAGLQGIATLQAGDACGAPAGLGNIHRLGNATQERAISLHVYGVHAQYVTTHVNHIIAV